MYNGFIQLPEGNKVNEKRNKYLFMITCGDDGDGMRS